MDLFGQTLVLYLVIGVGVAMAIDATGRSQGVGRWFPVVTALAFWPLYLPILLTRGREAAPAIAESKSNDSLADSIKQVDSELEAALCSLNGWAEGALSREHGRIADLRRSWLTQAERIREMDRILNVNDPPEEPTALAVDAGRMHNFDRLRRVRQQAADDLARSLASVRELVSLIHLERFSGAPAARAEELVAEIAGSVARASEPSPPETAAAD